jgi:hypothetical protein
MTRARLAAAAVVLHEFLHEFREPAISFVPGVNRKDPISQIHGWNFGETNLNRPKSLELLIEASCSLNTPPSLRDPGCTISCSKNVSLQTTQGRGIFSPMIRLGNIKTPLTGGDMEDPITTQDIVIAPSIRETASEDGAVLLDIEQGICFSLNPVGLRIWELLKKRHSVDQIADALAQDFPVSRSQLLSDVVEFLQSLEAKRLIHRADHTVAKQSWLTRVFPWAKERAQLH